eukprot:TRINITY_DN33788_c0_g1_i1.p1 TRINITY_DN33788_c0_g1~~TRINITY_DN33788_c0_g1_i1.p1  ORF type:complete len:247 (+),score=56.57 TRINITY_DN33788_c0_g1_i1:55-795(+)
MALWRSLYRASAAAQRHRDLYQVLGVPRDASRRRVREAFLQLAKRVHPDRMPAGIAGRSADADANFARLRAAYETLHDPERRRAYDRARNEAEAEAAAASAAAAERLRHAAAEHDSHFEPPAWLQAVLRWRRGHRMRSKYPGFARQSPRQASSPLARLRSLSLPPLGAAVPASVAAAGGAIVFCGVVLDGEPAPVSASLSSAGPQMPPCAPAADAPASDSEASASRNLGAVADRTRLAPERPSAAG